MNNNSQELTSVVAILSKIFQIKDEFGFTRIAYRGQANSDWKLESSAIRRIQYSIEEESYLTDLFLDYHDILIKDAKLKGYDRNKIRNFYDLELIAELQHRGAGTFLIDFTFNALVALWFATENITDVDENEELIEKDGAIFLIDIDIPSKFHSIEPDDIKKGFRDFFIKKPEIDYFYWQPSDINNRIPCQHSVFIFGYPEIEENLYSKILIPHSAKKSIRNELYHFFDISDESLFRDLDGFARINNSLSQFEGFSKEKYLELGIYNHQRGNFETAKKYYIIAKEKGDKHKAAKNLGLLYFNEGKYSESITELEYAMKYAKNDNDLFLLLAHSFYQTGEYRNIINLIKDKEFSSNALRSSKLLIGNSYFYCGEPEKAITEFSYAIDRLGPFLIGDIVTKNFLNKINMGEYKYLEFQNYTDITSLFRKYSIDTSEFKEKMFKRTFLDDTNISYVNHFFPSPADSVLFSNRGVINYTLQRYTEAFHDFNWAILLKQSNATAYIFRAKLAEYQENIELTADETLDEETYKSDMVQYNKFKDEFDEAYDITRIYDLEQLLDGKRIPLPN